MDTSTESTNTSVWPIFGPWKNIMGSFTNSLSSFSQPAYSQPILPGWSFGNITVTEQNSSAPDVEHDIVAEHSYGRQLGRIMQALIVLIDERPNGAKEQKAFSELVKLDNQIKKIKREAAVRRLERVKSDLEILKTDKPDEYQALLSDLMKEHKLKKAS